jgi:hypothetical protein
MRKQKERAERKEVAEATVPNYFKPIKLFCEMNDILLNWKKISKRSREAEATVRIGSQP